MVGAVEVTLRFLGAQGALEGRDGLCEVARVLAARLDTPGEDATEAGIASVARELRATLEVLELGRDGDDDDDAWSRLERELSAEVGDSPES